ncbi:Rad4-domain-containing protein [Paxillus ammoniavirescens]|nr:Rad4-domain-containing protein [Paxillus ammoniavirescens]
MAVDQVVLAGDSSDEELDWEEVHVPEQQPAYDSEEFNTPLELELSGPAPRGNIEITLQTRVKKDDSKKKASAALYAQRVARTTNHKIHTVALLANARVRNKLLNDELLHARLLSMTPLSLQNGFAMIHKSRVPDQNKRGRLFEAAIIRLVDWWSGTFFSVTPTGHIKNRTFDEVQEEISQSDEPYDPESDPTGSERIRSVNSLMKHALMQTGSRDTSSQLFTALCRALDIPARLVVSLQSIPWQSKVGKPAVRKAGSKGKGKAPQTHVEGQEDPAADDESEMEEVAIPSSSPNGKGKGKEKAHPVIKLRKPKSQSTSRGGSPGLGGRSLKSPDPTTTPPVFWTEVFSRADSRWLPVDPIRGIVNNRHLFDPTIPPIGSSKTPVQQDNRMLYVIGLEEDGFGRDITARYARDYTAKVSKVQGVGAGPAGKRKEWWSRVVEMITRPYRLQRDDLEDEELHNHQLTEGMPTTIAGFKDHPLYALTRHLRRDQVIDPPTELGKFRGEPVYPRSSVISLKTAENWMRQGRVIRQGAQPMKMVKQRAVTVNRQREMELALERANADGHAGPDEDVMQGLYAGSQTELYKPEPIQNGKIPKNDFGNIDLYVPSMLPEGAVHIPFKGAAKVAKKLGFDYAEAVTGFEFKKRRAFPLIEGIVVAADNENVIVDACLEAEQDAEEKARAKRLERTCKRWIRLVQGLRIRDRLQKQYASNVEHDPQQQQQQQQQQPHWLDTQGADADGNEEQLGGYLTTADDVVEPFHLPRDIHRYSVPTIPSVADDHSGVEKGETVHKGTISSELLSRDLPPSPTGDIDMEPVEGSSALQPSKGAPKTMTELAEYHAQQEQTVRQDGPLFEPAGSESRATFPEDKKSRGGRSSQGPNLSTRAQTSQTTRSSKKRTRRRSGSSSDHDVEASPPKRRQGASVTLASNAPPTRVLRQRPQKSAARIQEEQEMEEAYRRAVKG